MNDFTKEELNELSFWLNRLAILENKLDTLKPIHKKVNDIIDNYCEHDGIIGKDFPAEKCFKCNRMWE